MPPSSKAQARFMRAVCSGKAKNPPRSLSRKEACEYVRGYPTKGLPEKKGKASRRKAS